MSNAYIQTLKQLYQINKFHKIKLGLENISKFSRVYSRKKLVYFILPDNSLKVILFSNFHVFMLLERMGKGLYP